MEDIITRIIARIEATAAENPDGFTVDQSGLQYRPTSGFAVGFKAFMNIQEALEFLWPYPGCKLGGWVDQETGVFHLDAVAVFQSRESAINFGRCRNQIAIWDFGAQEEIRL